MNPILMQVVAEYATFLELSEDEVVDPDAAIRQLESLARLLQELTPSDRIELIEFFHEEAASELQEHGESKRFEVLEHLPEALGLLG